MSKLSETLKALIASPIARPGPIPAPRNVRSLYERIAKEAEEKNVGRPSWVALSTAATMTMNSPDSMSVLYQVASEPLEEKEKVETAELMREVGLKCIGFNGIPRTINMLGAFRASLPPTITPHLTTTPTRSPTPSNLPSTLSRGRALWNSIYTPFSDKLLSKLGDSHPDLPVHILSSHYGPLFTDPDSSSSRPENARVGRLLTSIVAIACLRAQTGVGPQVTSHIFGLRKAVQDGTWEAPEARPEEGARWLAGEEGNRWVIETVDGIVGGIGGEMGGSFAPGLGREKAKL
ncbi:hypothetical protein K402DRAFT_454648 [Aulographum hederae CBS 113979]|uniref:Mitochondrial protein n=1 Tax=Aulographum hederae CBS 113979 TaxID=1176131 RepID=A0A6G1GYC5_9PEZI|nr:hypothetical protein K402DRAFT_454648 [Aulographum hederae CBS 113979]